MTTRDKNTIVIGTRGSLLARAQTDWVADRLRAAHEGLEVRIEVIRTTGDRQSKPALPSIGGKGLFTLELEQALTDGSIDFAVHSAKDLPTGLAAGLAILGVPLREDARDALLSRDKRGLDDLPDGAVVGTSSLRRKAQLLMYRPDLKFTTLRGNIDTRIRKVEQGDCDATILAMAGLNRTGLADAATETLDMEIMLPAAGQGALALEGRADDDRVRRILRAIHDRKTEAALACERALIALLETGCLAPIGAHARHEDGRLLLDALVAMPDGTEAVIASEENQPDKGLALAECVAGRLREQGAERIIAASRDAT